MRFRITARLLTFKLIDIPIRIGTLPVPTPVAPPSGDLSARKVK